MNNLTKEQIYDLEKQKQEISKKLKEHYANEAIETLKSHQKYIGKCYKDKDSEKYYKVISEFANNQFRLTCLSVDLCRKPFDFIISDPTLGFTTNMENMEANVFNIEDVDAFTYPPNFFDRVYEISNEEFNEALDIKYQHFKLSIDELYKEVHKKAKIIYKVDMED